MPNENSLFDLTKVKTFRLDQLVGKTLTILKTDNCDGSIITATDTSGIIYILQIVVGKRRVK